MNQLEVSENVYDLPTSSNIELLPPPPPPPPSHEPQSIVEASSNHFNNNKFGNLTNTGNRTSRSNSIGSHAQPPPPVPPKPQFKRLNSIGGGENGNECEQTIEQKIMAARKRSLELKTVGGETAGNGSNPMLINELSTILARQKKKIEDSMNCGNGGSGGMEGSQCTFESQSNKSANDRLAGSPTLTKKPPPPPRSDRSHLSRRPSNDSRI